MAKLAGLKRKHAPAVEQEDIILVLEEGNDTPGDEAEIFVETEADAEAITQVDEGQLAQDDAVVRTVRDQAIKFMRDKHWARLSIPEDEQKMALQLFPKVRHSVIPGNNSKLWIPFQKFFCCF
jgi:hypothetical protein